MADVDEVAIALQRVLRAALANREPSEKYSGDLLALLLKQAHIHKVLPAVRDHLKHQLSPNQLEVSDRLLARQRDWVERVMGVLTEQCVVVKGPSLAATYPQPSTRYFADIDLLVSDVESLRAISLRLEDLGLRPAASMHVRKDPFSTSLAQLSVRYVLEERRPGFAGVECHALSYPTSWSWGLDSRWFEESTVRTTYTRGAAALDAKGMACVVLADMLLSKRPKHRDLVDAHFLFRRLSQEDVNEVANFAVWLGLESCVERLHDRFERVPIISRPDQLSQLHQLVQGRERRKSWGSERMWSQNILVALRNFSAQDMQGHKLVRRAVAALIQTRGMSTLWRGCGLVQEVPFQPDLIGLN